MSDSRACPSWSSAFTPSSPLLRILLAVSLSLAGWALAGAGVLAPGDAQLASGEYYDRVTFDGVAGDEVHIELASTAFDVYLVLLDPNDRVLHEEDDTPGLGLDVRAVVRLPVSGSYTVLVTSARPNETGAYRLTVAGAGAPAAAGGSPSSPARPGRA
ncbi:MAG: PPC domain-containing protein, partial [Trueperaceae bacterium]|nr:PPC domain-containing protein [Trueperaceae bacterium]